jgi:hypothetical protein
MFVNIINKHVLFYLILFGLLALCEGEMNNCDSLLSKSISLKIMRAEVKRTRKEGREMQGERGKDCIRK